MTGVDGQFDISRGVRQLICTSVEELLVTKVQTFAYAPAFVATIVAIILLVRFASLLSAHFCCSCSCCVLAKRKQIYMCGMDVMQQ
jgi:hypothetical protein